MKKAVAVFLAPMFFLFIHIAFAEQSSAEFILSIEGFYPEQEVILKPGESLTVIIKNEEPGTVALFIEKIPGIVFLEKNDIVVPDKNEKEINCHLAEKKCVKKEGEHSFTFKFTGSKKTKVRLWAGLLKCRK